MRFLRWRQLLLLPTLGFLTLGFALPLVMLMLSQVDGAYGDVLASAWYRRSLLGGVQLAAIATVLTVAMAIPVASLLATVRSRMVRSIIYALVLMPILTSAAVRSYAWIVIFSFSGPINRFLLESGISSQPVPMLYTYPATVVAVTHVLLPFAVLPIASSFSNLKVDVKHAAETLGAGRLRVLVSVVLPQIWPGCLTAGLIVFALGMGGYETVALVGGSNQAIASVQTYVAYQELASPHLSSALGVFILLIVLIVSAFFIWQLRIWERVVRG